MITQNLSNIPQGVVGEARWFRLFPAADLNAQKGATPKGWNNPRRQKKASDLEGLLGFDISGHGVEGRPDYCFLDFDHVLENGDFVTPEAEDLVNLCLLSVKTYAELSASGTGIHMILCPTAGTFRKMTGSGQDVIPLGSQEGGLDGERPPRLEIYYGMTSKQFVLTGNCYECDPGQEIAEGQEADELIRELLKMAKTSHNPVKVEQEAPTVAPEEALEMLSYVDPKPLSYTEWLNIGMALKESGCTVDVWENWSRKDAARFHEGECQRKWAGFKGNAITIRTLRWMALKGGFHDKSMFSEIPDESEESSGDASPVLEDYVASRSVSSILDDFMDSLERPANVYPTGLYDLDHLLDGGLYGGRLYTLGALTGLGKTTMLLQAADNIAQHGQDVFMVSLEMSRKELVSKSLSRLSYQLFGADKALSTIDILRGGLSRIRKDTLQEALKKYRGFSDRIFILEGMGNIGALDVRKAVMKHIKATGNRPAVIIDYLQILAPYDPRQSDKSNTDKAVLELKRLARDADVPVVVISSFNRESYSTQVNLTSLKESGGIEYSSDCVIGLQPGYYRTVEGESKGERTARMEREAKKASQLIKQGKPIDVELRILKNRSGIRGQVSLQVNLRYNTYQDYFDFDILEDEEEPKVL